MSIKIYIIIKIKNVIIQSFRMKYYQRIGYFNFMI